MTSVVLTRWQLWRYVWSNRPEHWEFDANEIRHACQVLGVPCPDAVYWQRVDRGLPVVRRKLLKVATHPKSIAVSRTVHPSILAGEGHYSFPGIAVSAIAERRSNLLSRLFYGVERLGFSARYGVGRWGIMFSNGRRTVRCSLQRKQRRTIWFKPSGERSFRFDYTDFFPVPYVVPSKRRERRMAREPRGLDGALRS